MRKMFLLFCAVVFFAAQTMAQRIITGTVSDDKGAPLPNVSVTVKGTMTGTITGVDGKFTISVPTDAKTLVVSFIGLGEKEIDLTSSSGYTITLSAATKDLQEVIVVAYGTQKRADLTGAVGQVKAPDIENKPFTSVDKALQGLVPGLFSAATSGAPGSNQTIRIRGISSISSGNSPLWVIDGIIINTGDASRLTTSANLLSTLNPNDIESISVLKDAAAASIYGSQGANGVIIITTKKGRAGVTKFRFDTEVGRSDIAFMNDDYRPLNAEEYFSITRTGLLNSGLANPGNVDAIMTANFGFGNGVDFNWFDAVTRKGSHQQYNLSASGGNDRTTFYLSGGHFIQEGTVIASQMKRTSGNVKVMNRATDRLTFTANLGGGFVNQRTPLAGGAFGNPVLSSYFLLPSRAARKPDGSLNITAPDFGPGALHNTIATSELDKRHLKQTSLRGSFNGEFKILQRTRNSLKFTTNLGGDWNVLEEDQYNNPFHGDGFNTTGRAFAFYTRYLKWTWSNYADYHHALNAANNIGFDFKLGYEATKSQGYFSNVQSQNFPPTTDLNFPVAGATPITASATFADNALSSVFTNLSFNYQDKYIIYGSYRRDGDSRFGYNTKFGDFWSVGASWNINKEAFMASMDIINQLKLRFSFGSLGNNQIGNYDWIPGYGYGGGFNYNQLPGSGPAQVGDSLLSWESSSPTNIGLDIGILRNRISVSADYFWRNSEDMILNVPLSRTSGFANAIQNIGAMENKGFELSIHAVPVQFGDFSWNVGLNYTHVKNKVTSLPAEFPNGVFQVREGFDIQTYFARVYAGVDPANGNPLWYVDSSRKTTTNNYNAAQRVMFGSASPTDFGNFTNTLAYKGFSLEAQFYYSFGNYVRDTWGSYYNGAGFGGAFNKVAKVLESWMQPGDVTDVPRYVYNGNMNAHAFSTRYLFEGDFIRLRNLQIGYDFSKSLLDRTRFLTNAFLYVRGANLWTWVKDKDLPFDPENGIGSQTNLEVYMPKTFTVGLNIGF